MKMVIMGVSITASREKVQHFTSSSSHSNLCRKTAYQNLTRRWIRLCHSGKAWGRVSKDK